MFAASKALRAFAAYRPELLAGAASASPLEPRTGSILPESVRQVILSIWSLVSPTTPDLDLFHTVYGLVLIQQPLPPPARRPLYDLELRPAALPADSEDGTEAPNAHLRILPDWGTSFFWRDAAYPKGPSGDCVIEDEQIKSQYPRLALSFVAWREQYEDAFEKQELHLGGNAEVFPDVQVRVAWDVEGFLMACWLVLQPGVKTVKYEVDSTPTAYKLDKASVGGDLGAFLGEMDMLLGDAE